MGLFRVRDVGEGVNLGGAVSLDDTGQALAQDAGKVVTHVSAGSLEEGPPAVAAGSAVMLGDKGLQLAAHPALDAIGGLGTINRLLDNWQLGGHWLWLGDASLVAHAVAVEWVVLAWVDHAVRSSAALVLALLVVQAAVVDCCGCLGYAAAAAAVCE